MKNNYRNLKSLFLSLFIFSTVLESSSNSIAVTPSIQIKQSQPQRTQPKKKRSTWETIVMMFKGKVPKLGSRGVCPVNPGILESVNIIWSDRPLFLWQGTDVPIEIRLYSSFDPSQDQSILWRQVLRDAISTSTFQGIQYTGEALEAGKIYDWEIFSPSTETKKRRSFRVMGLEERDRITSELKNLEAQLRTENATDEEIAIERSYYFAQQNLWSDALQEMYSVEKPSPELTLKVQELLSYICNPPK